MSSLNLFFVFLCFVVFSNSIVFHSSSFSSSVLVLCRVQCLHKRIMLLFCDEREREKSRRGRKEKVRVVVKQTNNFKCNLLECLQVHNSDKERREKEREREREWVIQEVNFPVEVECHWRDWITLLQGRINWMCPQASLLYFHPLSKTKQPNSLDVLLVKSDKLRKRKRTSIYSSPSLAFCPFWCCS